MRIAIIDDNEVNILRIKQLLSSHVGDCDSVSFTDSATGLKWCLENRPDLVMVDYRMPPPDGLQFIEAFRATPGNEHTPLLMLTAAQDLSVRHRALQLGASDFLNYPLDETEFLARVTNMLALRKSQQALVARADWLAGEVAKATEEIVARERETILRLSRAAEYRDPETGAHIVRMAKYCRLIAHHLGLPADEQALLETAAPMHDIGKVGIPDEILLKPGRLTPDELVIMRRHTVIGHEILKDSRSPILQAAALVALSHHERFDGGGYPQGLSGEHIPLYGRIVALADVFDALLSDRPYKKGWSLDVAVDYVKMNRGKHFDPACVDAFFHDWKAVLEIHAIGLTNAAASSL